MPLIASWMLLLTLATARRACCDVQRAMPRKPRATAKTTGAVARVSRPRVGCTATSTPTTTSTNSTWLIRSMVRVTTFEKSWVSEVTRLTIVPDGYWS